MHVPKRSKSYYELYKEVRQIGAGAFGKAVLVKLRDKSSDQFFIAKHIFPDKIKGNVKMEAEILKDLPSNYVVKYINSFQPDSKIFIIVMEYCKHGDLYYQIKSMKRLKKKYEEDQIMFWFVQMMMGLKDIHHNNVLHRDIKPDNLFITEDLRPMIGDFGISKVDDAST